MLVYPNVWAWRPSAVVETVCYGVSSVLCDLCPWLHAQTSVCYKAGKREDSSGNHSYIVNFDFLLVMLRW